ncbi:hypothetical protein EZV62_002912 [Acer yangbiense]|uniref:Serine-threonine/tyrosine-protein kinase catalytic domain-containing protein n=1 Tax=Acer yangbiense TaxID=1000413 RepID=A0A5C7IYP1_9ROSI|nr:hypothetical protein EZV62_002912 [Acer yangbiense]
MRVFNIYRFGSGISSKTLRAYSRLENGDRVLAVKSLLAEYASKNNQFVACEHELASNVSNWCTGQSAKALAGFDFGFCGVKCMHLVATTITIWIQVYSIIQPTNNIINYRSLTPAKPKLVVIFSDFEFSMKAVVVIESEMVTDRAMEDEFLETSTMCKKLSLTAHNFTTTSVVSVLSAGESIEHRTPILTKSTKHALVLTLPFPCSLAKFSTLLSSTLTSNSTYVGNVGAPMVELLAILKACKLCEFKAVLKLRKILINLVSIVSGTLSSSIGIKGTIGYVAPVTIDNNNVENFARLHGEGRVRMEECLVGALRIGVLCSMESPADRMEMTDVVAKLCAIRENFLSRRTGDVWPSSQ